MAKPSTTKKPAITGKKPANKQKKAGQNSTTRRKSKKDEGAVTVGLHGLGEILMAVHSGAPGLQSSFEKKLESANLSVTLDAATARMIEEFAMEKLSDHPTMSKWNNNNCDPATDPWCIGFGKK